MMPNFQRLEEATEALRRVVREATEANGVTKDTATTLFDPASRMLQPFALNVSQDHKQVTWADRGNRTGTERREDVSLQETLVPVDCRLGEGALADSKLQYFQPRSCNSLEGARVGRALLAMVDTRVDAAGDQSAGVGVEASR
jgi:hypothetical protein